MNNEAEIKEIRDIIGTLKVDIEDYKSSCAQFSEEIVEKHKDYLTKADTRNLPECWKARCVLNNIENKCYEIFAISNRSKDIQNSVNGEFGNAFAALMHPQAFYAPCRKGTCEYTPNYLIKLKATLKEIENGNKLNNINVPELEKDRAPYG